MVPNSGAGRPFVRRTLNRYTVEEQKAIVREGRNNMPAFGAILSDARIAAVVKFEREELDTSG